MAFIAGPIDDTLAGDDPTQAVAIAGACAVALLMMAGAFWYWPALLTVPSAPAMPGAAPFVPSPTVAGLPTATVSSAAPATLGNPPGLGSFVLFILSIGLALAFCVLLLFSTYMVYRLLFILLKRYGGPFFRKSDLPVGSPRLKEAKPPTRRGSTCSDASTKSDRRDSTSSKAEVLREKPVSRDSSPHALASETMNLVSLPALPVSPAVSAVSDNGPDLDAAAPTDTAADVAAPKTDESAASSEKEETKEEVADDSAVSQEPKEEVVTRAKFEPSVPHTEANHVVPAPPTPESTAEVPSGASASTEEPVVPAAADFFGITPEHWATLSVGAQKRLRSKRRLAIDSGDCEDVAGGGKAWYDRRKATEAARQKKPKGEPQGELAGGSPSQ